MTPSRGGAYAIGVVLAFELALLPWTAHSFDTTSFFLHADRVFFLHVSPVRWWAFGSIALVCLIGAQLPVLVAPSLANVVPLRIVLAKIPSWFSDMGTAAVVRACSSDAAYANWWALRYLADPAVLFTTIFHGQMDAIPNLLAVGGIALMLGGRYELSALALGAGAGTKFFPAAYVPLLLVVSLRNGSLRRSAISLGLFVVTAALTLLPVVAGRFGTVADFFANNSYGNAGDSVLLTSVWALVPKGVLRPQLEQLIAVLIPVVLAGALLRWRSIDARAIARTALWTVLSIVLLNPGAHAPFYLWIAGPLVLYAAVANDGAVSVAGIVLSCLAPLIQFCQEGSDEYFLLNFGKAPVPNLLRCVAPPPRLEWLVLLTAVVIVALSLRNEAAISIERIARRMSFAVSVAFFAAFVGVTGQAIAVRASAFGHNAQPYWHVVFASNTFTIRPRTRAVGSSECELVYEAGDFAVFAGNPYAAQYVRAFLGYTLFSPETMTIRNNAVDVGRLVPSYLHLDLIPIYRAPIRVTREFEITDALRPYRFVERFVEHPCTLIEGNPVLTYRLDLGAARDAAARRPLFERLRIFDRQEPARPVSIKGPNHV
ncbi:MAG TPA: glycosyltransferase family 87 protein [Candidatus Baltobacteraceae bacterium]|nr:glycosyltransferase family 87 protein [Candidatus Baltobacteraceae bacterium]